MQKKKVKKHNKSILKKVKRKIKARKPPIAKIAELKRENKQKSKKDGLMVAGKFVWTSKMSVNEDKIDSQHKSLLEEINELISSLNPESSVSANRKALHFLSNYIKEHFSYEEDYMNRIGFPGLEKHKRMHHGFVNFFNKFSKKFNTSLYEKLRPGQFTSDKLVRLANECKKFLGDWLVNHIIRVDNAYAQYALKNKKIQKGKIDVSQIANEVKRELIREQRKPVSGLGKHNLKNKSETKEYIFTGVSGFDELFEKGIPKGNLMIVAGGAGSGKTILCLQTLINKAKEGKKCLYMTLEESEDKLIQHMEDFGWPANELVKKGKLKIFRINPFDITRNVDALLAKQKGELLIDIDPVLLPRDFAHPDFIAIDSLTAIASAFTGKDESYRIYIEQLFRFLEKTGATGFLITETAQVPKIFSPTGVEEFLADGVIVLYNLKHGNVRENAIEVLKLRGASHKKKIVAFQIDSNGIVVYPDQEVFSEI
jgi:circadian clock protein KaiC